MVVPREAPEEDEPLDGVPLEKEELEDVMDPLPADPESFCEENIEGMVSC